MLWHGYFDGGCEASGVFKAVAAFFIPPAVLLLLLVPHHHGFPGLLIFCYVNHTGLSVNVVVVKPNSWGA